jgi:polysaccharide biosynthesis protein PslH
VKILLLTQILPFPPDAGPKVKTWHVLRYLVKSGHDVTLVSYVREDEQKHIPEVQRLGIQFHPVTIQRSRLMDVVYMLRSFITRRPFLIERDDLPQFRSVVNTLLSQHKFDVIHADQLTMTQFAQPEKVVGPGPARIFDAHNATWSIFERMQENASLVMKPVIALEARRLKQYEAQVVRNFEHTLVVTDQDRHLLAGAASSNGALGPIQAKIETIPIAVDTRQLPPLQLEPGSKNIVTLGTLHYPPNADGIRWFMEKVYPLVQASIPGITLTVIGKNPPEDFIQAASVDPSIQVTGYVPDLDPYLKKAALMVVPVRAGSGMRVRLLEAFSRGVPTITTTIGLEGIDAQTDVDVLVADTADDFARQVYRLMNDEALRLALAQNGRRLAETKYDWQVVLCHLENLYSSIHNHNHS